MIDSPKSATLTERLANSATGFAAVVDGLLLIGTAAETKNGVALNVLYRFGYPIFGCSDPDCECYIHGLRSVRPDVLIVPIRVEVWH